MHVNIVGGGCMNPDLWLTCGMNCDKHPKLSVIVITYNQSLTIGRALDSVLELRNLCPDMEIVLGDDASVDNTMEICRGYASEYPDIIRLMPSQPNMGLVANYFRCLKACRGEYVTDCAGDDCRLSGKGVAEQIRMLDADASLVGVGSDWEIDSNGKGVSLSSSVLSYARWRKRLTGREMQLAVVGSKGAFPVLLSSVVYRRMAVDPDDSMVCNDLFGCEDMPVMMALGAKGDFGFVKQPTYRYYASDASVSGGGDMRKTLDFYTKAFKCMTTLSKHYKVSPEEVRNAFRLRASYTVGLAFDLGDKERAAKVRAVVDSWPEKAGIGARLKLWLMRYSLLWNFGRKLYKPKSNPA